MASDNNKNTESFALGLIVAVIVYLILRRELSRVNSHGAAGNGQAGGGHGAAAASGGGGGCGCGGGGGSNGGAEPGVTPISIGGQSYSSTGHSYGGSSVAPPSAVQASAHSFVESGSQTSASGILFGGSTGGGGFF